MLNYCVVCRDIYNLLLGSVLPTMKSQNKWMNLPDNFGWKFELPFFLTKDSMLQWFQYRIIHRILGTNRLMFKMGVVDQNNCSFCNHFSETIVHLFWECRYVDQFWRDLIKWLSEEFQNSFTNWSKKDIIFGNRGMQISSNIIILLAKKTHLSMQS